MKRYKNLVVLIASATLLGNIGVVAQAAPTPSCQRYFNSAQQGKDALALLKDNLATVAQLNGKSQQAFKNLLNDSSYWLDECGLAFYVDSVALSPSTISNPASAPFAYNQTFL